jgi:hypothetical protein
MNRDFVMARLLFVLQVTFVISAAMTLSKIFTWLLFLTFGIMLYWMFSDLIKGKLNGNV